MKIINATLTSSTMNNNTKNNEPLDSSIETRRADIETILGNSTLNKSTMTHDATV